MSEEQTAVDKQQEEELKKRRMKAKLLVESFELGGIKPHTRLLQLSNKDPEFDYRLVKNKAEFISYRQSMGYEIDHEAESTSMTQADGRLIVAGKYVVMRRDRIIGDAHRAHLKEKARKAARKPRDKFRATARSMGVETEDKSRSRRGYLAELADPGDSNPNFKDED